MRHKHSMTWNMERNTEKLGKWEMHTVKPEIWQENWKKIENETKTQYDLEHGEKHWKMWKLRNPHCTTWNMAKKLKNGENETQTLYDLEYGEKPWKLRKIRNALVGPGFNEETKKLGKWESHTVGLGIRKK
jgi:hypothetical protein